jgi:hypothetical protein
MHPGRIRVSFLYIFAVVILQIGCSVPFHEDLFGFISEKARTIPAPGISPSAAGDIQFRATSVPLVSLSSAIAGSTIYYSVDGGATYQDYGSPFVLPYPADATVSTGLSLRAYATHPDYRDSPVSGQAYLFVPSVPAPVISPQSASPVEFSLDTIPTVSVSCSLSSATILYSVNSTADFLPYTGPFSIPVPADTSVGADVVVRAYAVSSGIDDSSMVTQTYRYVPKTATVQVQAPVVTSLPTSSCTYDAPPVISISCGHAGATVMYSIDSTTDYKKYPGAFTLPVPADTSIARDIVVRAYATASGYIDSPVSVATYHFIVTTLIVPAVSPPVIEPESPSSWLYGSPPLISISCAQSGAAVRYSVDSTTDYKPYTGSFTLPVPADTTIERDIVVRAYSASPGYTDSAVTSRTYHFTVGTVPVPPPAITPTPASSYEYSAPPTIGISCSKANATILYSIDSTTSFVAYSGAFTLPVPADTSVARDIVVRSYATAPGCTDSVVTSKMYHFNANAAIVPTTSMPVIAPAPAASFTYSAMPSISISCAQSGATVKYSIDSTTAYADYTASFTLPVPADTSVARDIVVRAYATAPGYTDSAVTTATYHFNAAPSVPAPTVAPVPAVYYKYTAPPTVTLSCSLGGATILYDADSTAVYSTYGAPFVLPLPADTSVAHDCVVRARATCAGYLDSPVTAVTYTYLPSNAIMTIAGNGSAGYSGDGGAAVSASFNNPSGVCVDAAGNVYVSDTANHRIRRIAAATGVVTTFAGTGVAGYSGDGGSAASARLSSPAAITASNTSIYVADSGNNVIREIVLATGVISTYAGTGAAGYGGDGGARISATFSAPKGITLDSNDKNLYIADTGNNCVRRIVKTTGIITTIAGSGVAGYSGDGGLATAATLSAPLGVGLRQSNKDVYIADTGNHRVRVIDSATGFISTYAGTGVAGFSGNGGAPSAAQLSGPSDVFVDNSGIFISDTGNHCVRLVSGGVISAFAGTGSQGFSGDRGLAAAATLSYPAGILITNADSYVVDAGNNRVRIILK